MDSWYYCRITATESTIKIIVVDYPVTNVEGLIVGGSAVLLVIRRSACIHPKLIYSQQHHHFTRLLFRVNIFLKNVSTVTTFIRHRIVYLILIPPLAVGVGIVTRSSANALRFWPCIKSLKLTRFLGLLRRVDLSRAVKSFNFGRNCFPHYFHNHKIRSDVVVFSVSRSPLTGQPASLSYHSLVAAGLSL